MSFTIHAGQSINLNTPAKLAGAATPLTDFVIGLTWGEVFAEDKNANTIDVDAMVLLLNADGQVTGDHDFIFYNQLSHPSGGVIHNGDDIIGGTIDETIQIHIDRLPESIVEIALLMSIDDAITNGARFHLIENPTVFVLTTDNNGELDELCNSPIVVANPETVTTAIVARLSKKHDGWYFNATSTGYVDGLRNCLLSVGVNV